MQTQTKKTSRQELKDKLHMMKTISNDLFDVMQILGKYNGKKLGPKTWEKIRDEIPFSCGLRTYSHCFYILPYIGSHEEEKKIRFHFELRLPKEDSVKTPTINTDEIYEANSGYFDNYLELMNNIEAGLESGLPEQIDEKMQERKELDNKIFLLRDIVGLV